MSPELLFPLIFPWGIGPAPTAQHIEPGVAISVEGSILVGDTVQGGGGVAIGVTPHERVRAELEIQTHTGFAMCIDCGAPVAGDLDVRVMAIRNSAFNLAPWGLASATKGGVELTGGIAAEGGTEHLRFDTSWPLVSSQELLTNLRIVPEVGVSMVWNDQQATRLAVLGLEPAVGLEHRLQLHDVGLMATLRYGEEGVGVQLGVSHQF